MKIKKKEIIILVLFIIVDTVESNKPQAPGVKDWDAYNRSAVGMEAREIRKGLRQGRW